MKAQTLWQRVARGLRDRSFIVGSALVVLFLLVAVLGPEVAPHNPFFRDRIQTIDGEMQRAPIPPCGTYPLGTDDEGRDLLSLLLYGARQTLVIAFVAMTLRLLLGLFLGTIAGWWAGSLFDRAVTAVIEFVAAVPGLILAILLVYAIGVRRGQVTFIIALSLVGWGEVTQIVRGHVLTLRNRLFIDAARSLGLSQPQILSRHVLPNLLSTLLAMAALEMGGVLLLLGELGFVHVFIGGGGMYIDDARGTIHYFEIPDWGAMLGTSWRYFRSLPWLPMAPALAFFVSILGFNLFGYGLQRFVEKGRFHPSGWSLLRFLAVVALLLLGARALLAGSSLEAQVTEVAREFDVQRAWNDVSYLARPALGGRVTGTEGARYAAAYIAQQFGEAGLTTLNDGTYFQSYLSTRGRVTDLPALELLDAGGAPTLRFEEGVTFDPWECFDVQGAVEEELVVVGNTGNSLMTDGVLLLLDPTESVRSAWFGRTPYAAILRVVPDDELWHRDVAPEYGTTFLDETIPNLLVGQSAARDLLAEVGLDLDELQATVEDGERITVETGLRVRVQAGLVYEEVTGINVIGYLAAADVQTEGDRILLMAPYTGAYPLGGIGNPGADENASGVAVMLEVARLWREVGFEPKRTVVFAAFDLLGGTTFAREPVFPSDLSDTWTAVVLHGVGSGESQLAREEVGSGRARSFDQSARRFHVRTTDLSGWPFFFVGGSPRQGYISVDPAYSGLAVTRFGDGLSGTPEDLLDHVDPGSLLEAGEVVAHYLMVLANR